MTTSYMASLWISPFFLSLSFLHFSVFFLYPKRTRQFGCQKPVLLRQQEWRRLHVSTSLTRYDQPPDLRRAQRLFVTRRISWVSTTGSSATRNSATSVALKNYVVYTRTTSLQKKLVCTRNNWWLRQFEHEYDTMPVRRRADLKQALSTLRLLKHQENTAHQQRWKSYSSSWWNWQESRWHSFYELHHESGPSTDWSGKPFEKWLGYLFEVWFSEFKWSIITVQNSVTANAIYCHRRGV